MDPPAKRIKIEINFDRQTEKLNRVGRKLRNVARKQACASIRGITTNRARSEVFAQGPAQIALSKHNDALNCNYVTKAQYRDANTRAQMEEYREISDESLKNNARRDRMQINGWRRLGDSAEDSHCRKSDPITSRGADNCQVARNRWRVATLICKLEDLGKRRGAYSLQTQQFTKDKSG